MDEKKLCPCGSGQVLAECCLPIIKGDSQAESAEQLMRSRYTAFVLGEVDWILASHHPDTVGEVDRDEIERWSKGSDWISLKIRQVKDGEQGDESGVVDFRARYRTQGQVIDHKEVAQFERHNGEWKFHSVSDEVIPREGKLVPVMAASTVGRNDPCTCGSGKKYKRCCGAA